MLRGTLVGRGLRLTLIALLIWRARGWAASRLARKGVVRRGTCGDPLTLVGAAGLLAIDPIAAYLPARRARLAGGSVVALAEE